MPLASQIVDHPCYNNVLKVAATTTGRDKFYRAVQYFARFAAFYALRMGYSKEVIIRLNSLKTLLGLSRKLMRIGKPLEHLQASVRASTLNDPVLRATTVGRQLGYALFLFFDNISWLQTAKVTNFSAQTADKINKNASRFWLAGILFSIANSLYTLREVRNKATAAGIQQTSPEKEADRKVEVKALERQGKAARFQLQLDVLDFLIPASALNLVNVDDGIVGIAGFITSIQGLRSQSQKVLGTSK